MSVTYTIPASGSGIHTAESTDYGAYSSALVSAMVNNMNFLNAKLTGKTPDGQDYTGTLAQHGHTGSALLDGAPYLGVICNLQPRYASGAIADWWTLTPAVQNTYYPIDPGIASPLLRITGRTGVNRIGGWILSKESGSGSRGFRFQLTAGGTPVTGALLDHDVWTWTRLTGGASYDPLTIAESGNINLDINAREEKTISSQVIHVAGLVLFADTVTV